MTTEQVRRWCIAARYRERKRRADCGLAAAAGGHAVQPHSGAIIAVIENEGQPPRPITAEDLSLLPFLVRDGLVELQGDVVCRVDDVSLLLTCATAVSTENLLRQDPIAPASSRRPERPPTPIDTATTKEMRRASEWLADATEAGTSPACTLLITEGMLAKAALTEAVMDSVGLNRFGVLALQGSIINTRAASSSRMSHNAAIARLVHSLGLVDSEPQRAKRVICGYQERHGSSAAVNFLVKFPAGMLRDVTQRYMQSILQLSSCINLNGMTLWNEGHCHNHKLPCFERNLEFLY